MQTFINSYNFAKRLKAIKGLTPWEFIAKEWKPGIVERFTLAMYDDRICKSFGIREVKYGNEVFEMRMRRSL